MGPFADGRVILKSWQVLPSVVAPAIMFILLFVLPLDMTMSRIFMSGQEHLEKSRLLAIIKLEGALFFALLLSWIPFFIKITSPVN
ncbi:MAG: hypothetical protein EXR86_16185 [Gammaproteobacteria bacterium]|nr:hypothetical protein [Gammaproteobacteria bacterium]